MGSGAPSAGACASNFDSEDGPAEVEFERVRTGNRCEFGERVAPNDSAAETPVCGGSAGGGLMGRSRGGLDGLSDEFLADGFLRFVVPPG